MTQTGTSETPKETPKDASAPVLAQHAATLKALPFSDTRDFDEAARGFLGTIDHARIANAQGRVVWSLEPYGFLSEVEAPPTVDPSLWRQSRLNMNHGLFEVCDRFLLTEGGRAFEPEPYPGLAAREKREAALDGCS